MGLRQPRKAAILLFLAALVAGGILRPVHWDPVRAVYAMQRQWGQRDALEGLSGYRSQSAEHFVIYFEPADKQTAPLLLGTAERLYEPVLERVGGPVPPPGPVSLVVHPSRESLRAAFGWDSQWSATGVYWRGVIRLLSPRVWLGDHRPREMARLIDEMAPLAHEFTHYVLDYRTDGNYPRWFSEGLAQWVEYELTGYEWIEADLAEQRYSLAELKKFDGLANQALAYRQSLSFVTFLVERWGQEGLERLLSGLAAGQPFGRALESATGHTPERFEQAWLKWFVEGRK